MTRVRIVSLPALLLLIVLPFGCVIDWDDAWTGTDASSDSDASNDADASVPDGDLLDGPERFCEDNWCWESPLPQGLALEDIWADDEENVFAVGHGGAILHFDGSRWWPMASGTKEDLKGIWGFSRDDIWAVGGSDVVHYDGEAWERIASCGDLTGVWGSSSEALWLVGRHGKIFRFDGKTCTSEASPTEADLNDVWGLDKDTVYAVGSDGTILRYDGAKWSEKFSSVTGQLNAVQGSSGDDVFVVGNGGVVLQRQQGAVWESVEAPTSENLFDLWSDGNGAHLVGSNRTVLRYTSSTKKWNDLTPSVGERRDLLGAWSDGDDALFVVGKHGALARRSAKGWTRYDSGFSGTFADVWASGPDDIYAVGQNVVWHYDGHSWESIAELSYGNWAGVWGSNADDVFIVGRELLEGRSAHFNGADWRAINPHSKGLNDVSGVGTDVYAVGYDGQVLFYEAGAWVAEETPTVRALYGVWVGPGLAYAVGHGGTVLRREGGAWTLEQEFTPKDLHAVWASGADDVHAVGEMVAARFDGKAWSVSNDAPSLKALWGTSADNVYAAGSTIERFDGKAWQTVTSIAAVEGIWGIAPGEMIAVGPHGILRRSAHAD